jgi:DNA-binding NtrC family response regulator
VKKVSVDVRVVAATNQDLEAAVAAGKFRSDLYHRLSQITLNVPPLRHRVADIGPLAQFFLEQQDGVRSFSPQALALLEQHSWAGNIRELRNVVIKAALMARGDQIEPQDLPLRQAGGAPRLESNGAGHAAGLGHPADLDRPASLDSMEQRMILDALQATGGHQQRAAARLGISRRTLSRKLKLYENEGLRQPV